jgi:hypothetical protein
MIESLTFLTLSIIFSRDLNICFGELSYDFAPKREISHLWFIQGVSS